MTALRRAERYTYAALAAIAIAVSCAKAENSPLADRGGDDEGGEDGGGKGGTGGAGATGGSAGSGASGGTTSAGGSAGRGGTTTGGSAGKGGSTTTGGSDGNGGSSGSSTTYGCLDDGMGGEGGASGGAPSEAGAGGAGPMSLFFDDFEDGDANGWTPTGGLWGIVRDGSSVYEQTTADSTSQFISAVQGTCWADQIVEARVRVVSFNGASTSNAAAIFARYVSPQTHYMLGMNSGNGGELFIGKRVQSTSTSPERIARDDGVPAWDTSRFYKLRLEVMGSDLKAYVDDVLALEVTDTEITSGGVAVGVRHANARFDDVKVTVP